MGRGDVIYSAYLEIASGISNIDSLEFEKLVAQAHSYNLEVHAYCCNAALIEPPSPGRCVGGSGIDFKELKDSVCFSIRKICSSLSFEQKMMIVEAILQILPIFFSGMSLINITNETTYNQYTHITINISTEDSDQTSSYQLPISLPYKQSMIENEIKKIVEAI